MLLEKIKRIYFPHWLSTLQYGHYDAQEASMYALRSWGWEVHGEDVRVSEGLTEFMWLAKPPWSECYCVIAPEER